MSVENLDSEGLETESPEVTLPEELLTLSSRIDERPESFAIGNKDIQLAALQAAKFVFDRALKSEANSRAQIAAALSTFSPTQAPQTRSQAKKKADNRLKKPIDGPTFQETPLPELCIDGMDEGQVWAQMELRANNLCKVLEFALRGAVMLGEDEEGLESSSKRTVDEDGMDVDEEEEDFDDESDDWDSEYEDEDEEQEGEESSEGEFEGKEDVMELRDPSDDDEETLDLDSAGPSSRKRRTKGKKGGHPELDDGFFDLAAFNAETEAAEARQSSRGKLGREDEDEDEDAELEDVDMFAAIDEDVQETEEPFYKDFFAPPSKLPAKTSPKKVPPTGQQSKRKGSVRFHEEVRIKNIKARGKNLPLSAMLQLSKHNDDEDDGEGDFGIESPSSSDNLAENSEEDEDDDDDEDEDEDINGVEALDSDAMDEDDASELESESFDQREAIERLKDDLFADDDEEKDLLGLSTYEKRQADIGAEIAALESENVSQKHWTLMGEATSKSRPQNALLEEDLEFERIMKSVPVITEETVQGLEERIKTRILEQRFDDVVRKRPVDDKPFLPSRFFELQDTKSKQSLAEIYEDEFTKVKSGQAGVDDRDGKLAKEHQEISQLWEGISSKLDALCNAHFTPKAPKASISTIANVSAASLESALPTTMATSTMLAPEEVFTPSTSDLRARSELTPTQKRALHNKEKKAKRKQRDALEKSVDQFAKGKRSSEKKQKEAALKSVVKNGKGVTVIGKKSKDLNAKKGKS